MRMTISLIFIVTTVSTLPLTQYQREIVYKPGDLSALPIGKLTILPLSIGSQKQSTNSPPAGNIFQTPVLHSVNLFAPNTVQQPAATPGQLENYREALEEEAREAEREQNAITRDFRGRTPGFSDRPRIYLRVNVNGGVNEYNYGYRIEGF